MNIIQIKLASTADLNRMRQEEQEQAYLMEQDGSRFRNKGKYLRHLELAKAYQKEVERRRAQMPQGVER